jgi:hypothetical protein
MEETIKALLHLSSQLRFMYETVKTINQSKDLLGLIEYEDTFYRGTPFDGVLSGFVLNLMLIKSCAFIDEYNQSLSVGQHPSYRDRILRLKNIVQPAKDRINKWTDLRVYRNEILAHSFKRHSESLLVDGQTTAYNIPFTDTEIVLLFELITLISVEIGETFPEFRNKLDPNKPIKAYLNIEVREIDRIAELNAVRQEMAKRRLL